MTPTDVAAAAERELQRLREDGVERINGGAMSLMDRDRYLVSANYIPLAASRDRLTAALTAFVDYYANNGIGECPEGHDDCRFGVCVSGDSGCDADDQFDGDERFNVRQARAALAADTGKGE